MESLRIFAMAAALCLVCSASARAQVSENIDATAGFTAGVTLGNEQDIAFGNIDYSAAPGGGDTISIGTDGSLSYVGVFSGGAVGTAGSVQITAGNNGVPVDVFCDMTATLTDGAGGSIGLAGIEVAPQNLTGAFGAASDCNGLGGGAATSLVLNLGTLDTFVFGAQVDGGTAAGFAGGSYSTGNAGGDDVQVNVFYQ